MTLNPLWPAMLALLLARVTPHLVDTDSSFTFRERAVSGSPPANFGRRWRHNSRTGPGMHPTFLELFFRPAVCGRGEQALSGELTSRLLFRWRRLLFLVLLLA